MVRSNPVHRISPIREQGAVLYAQRMDTHQAVLPGAHLLELSTKLLPHDTICTIDIRHCVMSGRYLCYTRLLDVLDSPDLQRATDAFARSYPWPTSKPLPRPPV